MKKLMLLNDVSAMGKVLMCVWRDGFDPNDPNKCNRGSVHIISMSRPAAHDQNQCVLSFVVALSREEHDHASIREMFGDTIEKFWCVSAIHKVGAND